VRRAGIERGSRKARSNPVAFDWPLTALGQDALARWVRDPGRTTTPMISFSSDIV
jgi:hypothetical protein